MGIRAVYEHPPPYTTAGRTAASCDFQDGIKQSPFPKGPTSPLVPEARLLSGVLLLLCPSSQRCRAGEEAKRTLPQARPQEQYYSMLL